MNEQPTFADLDYQHKRRRTRREEFLERMDSLILSRAMGCWASGAEQKCTTREFISQRNCPRQLFGTSVTEAGWRQAGRVSEDGFWRDLWVV